MEDNYENERPDLYSNRVRAGKRTYFFDVKSTRNSGYYITITESKKKTNNDGSSSFEKHKIFLYREDFKKFAAALNLAIEKVKEAAPDQTWDNEEEDYTIEERFYDSEN